MEQDSIPTHKLARVASLAGTGAQVGLNYLRYHGKRAITGDSDRTALHQANATQVYSTFSKLKGGPLKLAQMLSIDRNILPQAYIDEFSQAQYSAPPLSYPLVARTFRREFGKAPSELFDEFSQSAAHGASIGQVHRARRGDQHFAVKVQYPGVADSLKSDLRVVKPIAMQLFGLREKDLEPYFEEVEKRLLEETDYVTELARSIELSDASAHLHGVQFPQYFPDLSSRRILTMSWVDGLPLDRFADSNPSQEVRDKVGQALWDFYHFQIHELRQFHADPHPGNFLVGPDHTLYVLDFGCTKQMPEGFYEPYFRLLDPAILADPSAFEKSLEVLEILLPDDAKHEREVLYRNAHRGTEMLAKPFHLGSFDFGDPAYMEGVFKMAEENRREQDAHKVNPFRGTAHALYVNRAYFGLYSLMGRLKARIETRLPEGLFPSMAHP
jgi:predicted unusual protein kinase regulating ubiquinone biosynthesis (AarF/ABC1/UbiB family)